MPTSTGKGRWEGSLREGKGKVSFGSFEAPYTFGTRFGSDPGTNPEQLLGAAHAACFSMALSGGLTKAGHVPDHVETVAHVTVENDGSGFSITKSHLVCEAKVPGMDDAAFQEVANEAKAGCPVSRSLKGLDITLEATLLP